MFYFFGTKEEADKQWVMHLEAGWGDNRMRVPNKALRRAMNRSKLKK